MALSPSYPSQPTVCRESPLPASPWWWGGRMPSPLDEARGSPPNPPLLLLLSLSPPPPSPIRIVCLNSTLTNMDSSSGLGPGVRRVQRGSSRERRGKRGWGLGGTACALGRLHRSRVHTAAGPRPRGPGLPSLARTAPGAYRGR